MWFMLNVGAFGVETGQPVVQTMAAFVINARTFTAHGERAREHVLRVADRDQDTRNRRS